MTDLERGVAVFELPACHFCGKSEPIAHGTYQRVNFVGIGIELVCDDCAVRADGPDEWVQHHEGYDLVVDGAE